MKKYILLETEKNEAPKDIPEALIDCSPWRADYPYAVNASGRLFLSPQGLRVELYAAEPCPVKEVTRDNGSVWEDSCLELFFMPDSRNGVYYNFECNANGAMLVGKGTERNGRELLEPGDGFKKAFSINTRIGQDGWSVSYLIPRSLLGDLYMPRMNLYKCLEKDPARIHFLCWNEIAAEKPDFHRPEAFGEIEIVRVNA